MRGSQLFSMALVAAGLVMSAADLEAGHRRRCQGCSSGGAGSHGGWYHFTSGGGMYVPQSGGMWAGGSTGPAMYGHGQMIQQTSYAAPSYRPAFRSCSSCGHR